jgi:hypothetical protein
MDNWNLGIEAKQTPEDGSTFVRLNNTFSEEDVDVNRLRRGVNVNRRVGDILKTRQNKPSHCKETLF